MSTRQMARTVIDGRMVIFSIDGGEVRGYLSGQDDFHWMVITPEAEIVLVHKGSVPSIRFGETSYAAEPLWSDLEGAVGPFRQYIEKEFFGRKFNDGQYDASFEDELGLASTP